jgi:hypothetical protein
LLKDRALPELGRMPLRLHVEQEVDVALAIAPDRLAAMVGDWVKPSRVNSPASASDRARKLDELEAVEAERIVAGGHRALLKHDARQAAS